MQHFRSRNSWPKWKSSSSVMLLSAEKILPFWLKGFWLPLPQAIEIGQAHLINNHSCLEDGMWASTLESLQFILSRIIAQSPSGIDKGYFFFSLTSGWGYLGSKLPPKLWTMSNSKGTFASCHSMILLWEVIRESWRGFGNETHYGDWGSAHNYLGLRIDFPKNQTVEFEMINNIPGQLV